MLKPYKRAELKFEQIREIGQDGRNSSTWIANDLQLGAEIVIKTILKRKIKNTGEYFNESKALYTTAHQNVVQIYYACEDEDYIYIAMPFYNKGSVKGLMENSYLTTRQIIKIGCQVLSGLHNIHSKGLIHFDIKPDNILLSDRGEALISDFGLAKQMQLGRARPNALYVSMAPPEATKKIPFDLRFDIYQFGLTLYRMAVGNNKFNEQFKRFIVNNDLDRDAFAQAIQLGTFPDRQKFDEHVPIKMRKVIKKCLEPDPNDRFSSALAVANALAKASECFDWHFIPDGDKKIWIKNESGTEKIFTVNLDRSTTFTISTNGKTPRRKVDLCRSNATQKEIEDILKKN